jgi:hypothetical protein
MRKPLKKWMDRNSDGTNTPYVATAIVRAAGDDLRRQIIRRSYLSARLGIRVRQTTRHAEVTETDLTLAAAADADDADAAAAAFALSIVGKVASNRRRQKDVSRFNIAVQNTLRVNKSSVIEDNSVV